MNYIPCESCGKEEFCHKMENYVIGQTEYLCSDCLDNLTEEERKEYEDNNS